MNKPLWQPSLEQIKSTQLYRFTQEVRAETGLELENYQQLHQWSVQNPALFWSKLWQFTAVLHSSPGKQVLVRADRFQETTWFEGARLNFAENLLRHRSEKTALISRLENGQRRTLSYSQLYLQVARVSAALRRVGIVEGDRVAGFMPNVAETVVAMLAATSIGAIWSSCSPDFGIDGVMDRFGQIQPKVLFCSDGYFYNGQVHTSLPTVRQITERISGIELVVLVEVTGETDLQAVPGSVAFNELIAGQEEPELVFEQLPFDHPLYIMYSSGTTGVPKCIVHGAGGTLLQQLKEQQLHVDVRTGDVLFYFTTCGWMMWNWLVAGLASEATLLLYDGSPFYPEPRSLMDMAEQEQISIFGASAKYIASLEKSYVVPRETHNLENLRTLLSTGSPLSHESYEYVYRDIKTDLCLSSISGGTDIISCFVLGNPCLPVWPGEIQCPGLGMAVEIWDENADAVEQTKGELVCTMPFPSAPIYFWNDPDGEKYHAAYFESFAGVWAHGDYGEVTEHQGMIIHGRSDAVLNPQGVRIGTAEIYRQVERFESVLDSICIGQNWQNDVRVVLFVVLREGLSLSPELQQEIRQVIRRETTPRHVPAKIIAVAEIPRTISGKIVELAVRKVVHGEPVVNTDALANPQALKLYENLSELQY
jgi:acetoacetyl-CoA synthetase